MKAHMLRRSALVFCVTMATSATRVGATDPLAAAPAGESGQPSMFSAAGSIDVVDPKSARIAFFANKPFWGPPRFGRGQFVLWPADTLFILQVPGPTPITIDGKKAGFAQLKAGQTVEVRYVVAAPWGGGLVCTASRIEARSPAPAKRQTQDRKPRTGQ